MLFEDLLAAPSARAIELDHAPVNRQVLRRGGRAGFAVRRVELDVINPILEAVEHHASPRASQAAGFGCFQNRIGCELEEKLRAFVAPHSTFSRAHSFSSPD